MEPYLPVLSLTPSHHLILCLGQYNPLLYHVPPRNHHTFNGCVPLVFSHAEGDAVMRSDVHTWLCCVTLPMA